jgi:hypothetical protein
MPLALTDAQLDAVYRAAGPLAPAVRGAFLELVAQSLAGAGEIGDGTVARVCAEVQRRFLIPPELAAGAPGRARNIADGLAKTRSTATLAQMRQAIQKS